MINPCASFVFFSRLVEISVGHRACSALDAPAIGVSNSGASPLSPNPVCIREREEKK